MKLFCLFVLFFSFHIPSERTVQIMTEQGLIRVEHRVRMLAAVVVVVLAAGGGAGEGGGGGAGSLVGGGRTQAPVTSASAWKLAAEALCFWRVFRLAVYTQVAVCRDIFCAGSSGDGAGPRCSVEAAVLGQQSPQDLELRGPSSFLV